MMRKHKNDLQYCHFNMQLKFSVVIGMTHSQVIALTEQTNKTANCLHIYHLFEQLGIQPN